eukprot:CAMPEP_0181438182 /NCGR_PEP_ID=MMETSP1110-20121109/21775_1 /TAXON_ID=174948 /ORGANISM="Symbiodinium sp., Strain CCMP421" /LENGTH=715 /DNA_ID=CAMNT_0023561857 /DNA_START=79 /DNA_END=2226 /DNA_ORIENTATION=-
MPKGSGGGGRVSVAKQKWVPKGAEHEVQARGGKENEERAPVSTGPKYDRHELLRTYGTCKSNGGALPILQESNAIEAPKELKYVLEDRPEDADAGGRSREAGDKVKAMKRQTSESMDEQPDVQTPGGKVDLLKELGTEASTPAAPDPMILAYLQSMMSAFAYPGMPYPGGFTTVMLRNIPNRYTRDMLIARLDKGYKNLYDFVYLPIDFSSKCNVGYAFINFRTPGAAHRFHTEFHGTKTKQCLPGFSSSKVAEVSFARVQGRDQNMENLRDEKFMEKLHDRPDWQPLFLDESGKEIPFSKAFPGDKKRSKKPATPATPTYIPPTTPTGYMRPPPSFPTFQPSFSLPPAPASTFASLLPSASADTLLMLKGVPVSYTRDKFVDTLKSKYGAAFDFIFLPNDAKSEGNRGHAFVNFSKSDTAKQFQEDFMGKAMKDCFDGTEEEKACEVVPARMESLEKTIQRLQSRKEAESPESPWLPLLFGEDGEVKPFPSLSAPDSGAKDEAEPKAKAKQKDRKQGSKESTPSAAKGGYQYPQGYYGFPGGFPPYPGYNPAVYAYAQLAVAQNAQAIQVAQLQAQASARKHGGKGGAKSGLFPSILDPLAAAVNHKENEELSDDQKAQLRHQVEYYFSTDNLCKDLFLREHMERDGWVALDLIRTFPRVSKFSVSSKKLMEACAKSEKLEIDDNQEKIRLANADERSKWANTPVPPDYKKRSA